MTNTPQNSATLVGGSLIRQAKRTPWYYYRLGDVVKRKKFRDSPQGRGIHYRLYPDSIASQYMRKTNKNNDLDILVKLVKEYPLPPTPKKQNEVVVQLRVGETIDRCIHTVDELLEKERKYISTFGDVKCREHKTVYVYPSPYYASVIHDLQTKPRFRNISNVTIVAGGCKEHNFTKSKIYIQKIKELFEENGFKVGVRFGSAPDDDFVYMCRSKFFIRSGGGFSSLIKHVITASKT